MDLEDRDKMRSEERGKRRERETKPEETSGDEKERTRAKIRQTHEEKNIREISQQQPH